MDEEQLIKTDIYDSELSTKLKPNCFREMYIKNMTDREMLNIKKFDGTIYLLLSKKFFEMDLRGEHIQTEGENDCSHLLTLGLCRKFLFGGVKLAIVFDNCQELYRFQKLSLGTVFVTESSTSLSRKSSAMCKISHNNKTVFFKTFRYGRSPPLKFREEEAQNRTTFFPDNSIAIPLFLVRDFLDIREKLDFDLLIYAKTKREYYQSKYPKISSNNRPEIKLKEILGTIPLWVLVSDSMCLPRTIDREHNLLIPVGLHYQDQESFKFKIREVPHLTIMASSINSQILELLDVLPYQHQKVNLSHLILCAFYGPRKFLGMGMDPVYLRRTSQNIEIRQRIEDVITNVTDLRRHTDDFQPEINGWGDIYELRKRMRTNPVDIDCVNELLPAFEILFNNLFYDAVSFRVQSTNFDLTKCTLETITDRNTQNFLILEDAVKQKHRPPSEPEPEEFDPETPVAYVQYLPGNEAENPEIRLEASYFILENESKKYIYYCLMDPETKLELKNSGSKPITELLPGDVIEKKYWDYPTLRGNLLEYIKQQMEAEGDMDGKLARLRKKIDLADQFKSALYSYVSSMDKNALQMRFSESAGDTEMKSLLLGWVSTVMRPRKESIFQAVLGELKLKNPDAGFLKIDVLSILDEIKDQRKLFKNSKEYQKETETYVVVQGPLKAVVEAEKIGKIYRYS